MANQEIIILPNHIIINLISWPGIFPVCALNAQLRDKINCTIAPSILPVALPAILQQ